MNRHIILTGLILAAVGCMIIAPVAMAQQFTPPTPQERVDEIDKAVKLTDDQKAQILKIYTDASANARQGGRMRGGFGGGGSPAAIEKVLTPDQVKKWRAYTLQQSVDRRIAQIERSIELTDAQKKKMMPVFAKEITAQNALMTKMRNQGEDADREAMRDKMTEMRDATDKALGTILTEDQLKQYNDMPRRGMGRGMRRQ